MTNNLWSKDYQSAKKNFINSIDILQSKDIEVQIDSLEINEYDIDGNSLCIDIAYIGKIDAKKIYISTSGIHGVEGFAGSAIQLEILNNIKEIRSVPRGFGSYGDMVLILNDGSKVEMKSLPSFREKQTELLNSQENLESTEEITH